MIAVSSFGFLLKLLLLLLLVIIISIDRAVLAAAQQQQALLGGEPVELWTFQMFPPVDPFSSTGVLRGNGVFMAPDGTTAIVTTVGGAIFAFDAYLGDQIWAYAPEPAVENSITRTHGGVSFHRGKTGNGNSNSNNSNSNGDDDDAYMVFSVVDNEYSRNPLTRVAAVDMAGNELWISDALDGIAVGDPLVSSDGGYVFLVHNSGEGEETNGVFTILDANANATGTVVLSRVFEGIDPDANATTESFETVAFGPPGIYHDPIRGNYDPIDAGSDVSEGDGNTNDMILWGQMPKSLEQPISGGYVFGFQFPKGFVDGEQELFERDDEHGVSFFPVGDSPRDFQAVAPPVITNQGLSTYWGVSRSSFRGWISKRFSRGRNAKAGFDRNPEISGQPVFAAPALSNDGPEPFVFGGTASTQFVRMSFDFSERIVVPTEAYVKSRALVDETNRVVYYVENNGKLHQANFDDLTDVWTYRFPDGIEGEIGITRDSDVIIIADVGGFVRALRVS